MLDEGAIDFAGLRADLQKKMPLLSNKELLQLFISESQDFVQVLDTNFAFFKLKEIRIKLRVIADELDQRRKDGRMDDC